MILPLPPPKSIKQSRGKMTRQSYKNIIRPTQHVIFCARDQQNDCFRQSPPLASRRFRLAGQHLLLPSAQCSPSVPFFFVTAVWPNGMVRATGIKRDLVLARAHNKNPPSGGLRRGIGYKSTLIKTHQFKYLSKQEISTKPNSKH